MKLELFQVGGSFKTRGCDLGHSRPLAGAASPRRRDRQRRQPRDRGRGGVARRRYHGARLHGPPGQPIPPAALPRSRRRHHLVDDVHQAFAAARAASENDGLAYIHPFEGQAHCHRYRDRRPGTHGAGRRSRCRNCAGRRRRLAGRHCRCGEAAAPAMRGLWRRTGRGRHDVSQLPGRYAAGDREDRHHRRQPRLAHRPCHTASGFAGNTPTRSFW